MFVSVRACVCVFFLFSCSVCYLFICISLQFGGIKVPIKKIQTLIKLIASLSAGSMNFSDISSDARFNFYKDDLAVLKFY